MHTIDLNSNIDILSTKPNRGCSRIIGQSIVCFSVSLEMCQKNVVYVGETCSILLQTILLFAVTPNYKIPMVPDY